jgi:hypothetical protein
MLPFDIRHPSRDALFNLHRERQTVTDLETADCAIVGITDVLEKAPPAAPHLEVRAVVPIGNIELNENMEFASPR